MNEDTGKLIELVRERVYLYDKQHPEFKDVELKRKVWSDIAEELHQSSKLLHLSNIVPDFIIYTILFNLIIITEIQ